MPTCRLALANLPFPASREDAVTRAVAAIADASRARADIACFPEGYVPGYRAPGKPVAPPEEAFLEQAWREVAAAAAAGRIVVVLGTEQIIDHGLRLCAIVIDRDGRVMGRQDKVQLDPSEEATYTPGTERHVFTTGPLTFGVAICHEGWRYPETVRWAARRGAQVVFHPHFHEASADSYRPATFADPANTFHEKALLCRAAENTCYIAAVNCASPGSPTTSVVVNPDGTVRAWQPYGEAGLLVVDIDLDEATGELAKRLRV